MKQAVEAEKKSMQEMAVHGTMNDSLLSVGGGNDLLKNDVSLLKINVYLR